MLLGFTGFVFTFGLSALWMVPGIWGGYALMWLLFGPRVRAESAAQRWVTPTEFLAANLDKRSAAKVAALAALLIAFCFIFYIAAQLDAAAAAFVANFDVSASSSLFLSAGIILFYCLLGGFWAASITDTLQAVMMMLAALIVPLMAVIAAGGPAGIAAALAEQPANYVDWFGGMSGFLFAGFVLGLWGIGVATSGQPQLIARLMAVRGDRERKLAFAIALSWGVLVYIGVSSLALSARALTIEPESGEQIFYLLAADLLPPILGGIVIAAILSAVMSTVDSLLLAACASVSHDLGLAERFRINELKLSRIVMVAIVVAATLLSLTLPDTIFNRVLFAWNALGAAFGPIVLARVLGREPGAAARLWSIVTGFGLTVIFYSLGNMPAEASGWFDIFVRLAHLPGDPFERIVPFVPPILILFLSSKRSAAPVGA